VCDPDPTCEFVEVDEEKSLTAVCDMGQNPERLDEDV
jgi:hypothetical protein